jgi:hypothetical protein
MTAFSQLNQADGTIVEFEPTAQRPAKRPSRWSIANWPVRWKVFAIVLVPLVLAGTFGGLRIYSSDAGSRLAAGRRPRRDGARDRGLHGIARRRDPGEFDRR